MAAKLIEAKIYIPIIEYYTELELSAMKDSNKEAIRLGVQQPYKILKEELVAQLATEDREELRKKASAIDYTSQLSTSNLSRLVAKSEEILLKWWQDKRIEAWYKQNGIEPIKRLGQEMPNDQELEELLNAKIEGIKYEDEKTAKVRNEDFWLYQMAAMRALREEATRFC